MSLTLRPPPPAEPVSLRRRPTRRRYGPYLSDLNAEWDRLNAGLELLPSVEATLDTLRRSGPAPLQTVGCLDDVLAAVSWHTDPALLFLLRRSQAGDYIAARAIIQAMLPKLVRIADSVRHGRGFDTVLAEAVAAMRELIFTYPTDRRPRSVAGNLALDTLKAVRVVLGADIPYDIVERLPGPATDSSWSMSCPLRTLGAPGGSVSDELAAVLRSAQDSQILGPVDAALLWRIACSGETSASIAAGLGLTPEALRKRCSRLKARLRAHATELAA